MTMTIQVPQDLENLVGSIPNIESRVIAFLRHQASLEEWRKGRYSALAQEIAATSKVEAEQKIAAGITRADATALFKEVHGRISSKL